MLNDEELREARGYFKFYSLQPAIFAMIVGISILVIGIIDSCNVRHIDIDGKNYMVLYSFLFQYWYSRMGFNRPTDFIYSLFYNENTMLI